MKNTTQILYPSWVDFKILDLSYLYYTGRCTYK